MVRRRDAKKAKKERDVLMEDGGTFGIRNTGTCKENGEILLHMDLKKSTIIMGLDITDTIMDPDTMAMAKWDITEDMGIMGITEDMDIMVDITEDMDIMVDITEDMDIMEDITEVGDGNQ